MFRVYVQTAAARRQPLPTACAAATGLSLAAPQTSTIAASRPKSAAHLLHLLHLPPQPPLQAQPQWARSRQPPRRCLPPPPPPPGSHCGYERLLARDGVPPRVDAATLPASPALRGAPAGGPSFWSRPVPSRDRPGARQRRAALGFFPPGPRGRGLNIAARRYCRARAAPETPPSPPPTHPPCPRTRACG